MVAGELVMEDVYIIVLIQPTEIDEQQDETFIPKFSITDTIWNLLNFLVYPLSGFDVCEDELKCIRALGKKLLRLIADNQALKFSAVEWDSIHGKANKPKWLCENHVVLLPEFKTQNMVKNDVSLVQGGRSSALRSILLEFVDVSFGGQKTFKCTSIIDRDVNGA
ncbi:10957_t:CDS:2, partial [Entrophospora sp. SA101]